MTIKIITADNLTALETAVNAYTPPEGKVAGTPIQLAGGPWAVMIPLTDETSSDDSGGGDDNSGGGDDNSGGGDDNSGGGDDNSGGGDDNSGGGDDTSGGGTGG